LAKPTECPKEAPNEATIIFKILNRDTWAAALEKQFFAGAPVDVADGYIHFSTAGQLSETAAKHFHGQPDLLVVAFRAGALGEMLRWEPSRGGKLFPHLYCPLNTALALWTEPMPLDKDGTPMLPERVTQC